MVRNDLLDIFLSLNYPSIEQKLNSYKFIKTL